MQKNLFHFNLFEVGTVAVTGGMCLCLTGLPATAYNNL